MSSGERNLRHIILQNNERTDRYAPVRSGRGANTVDFKGDRKTHGEALIRQYSEAWESQQSDKQGYEEDQGAYITFEARPDLELVLDSLESQRSGDQPRIAAVKTRLTLDNQTVEEATVYIPKGKKQYLLDKLTAYVKSLDTTEEKQAKLVESISSIHRATLRELWTADDESFPQDETKDHWWEVWLWNQDGQELDRLLMAADAQNIMVRKPFLAMTDRIVVLLRASVESFEQLFAHIDDIAELRPPHDLGALFVSDLPAYEQAEWSKDLLSRLRLADTNAPVVCILDTGVQHSHELLTGSLDSDNDIHRADSAWKHDPVSGSHGTEMAGLALFGDLNAAVTTSHIVHLQHRLESVKILPNHTQNEPELYGAITARGVDQPEIQRHDRNRVFLMAVTAKDELDMRLAGQPTSWSATLDALSFGRSVDETASDFIKLDRDEDPHPRLFIVSAGNIRDLDGVDNYLDRCDTEPIEDPAQSWNCLTVGAYSDRSDMREADESFSGWQPVATEGELSPVSRTSVVFDSKKWPPKPEVVADGGNYAKSPVGDVDFPSSLGILTTNQQSSYDLPPRSFTITRDTSAATAQVSAIAADIWAQYPDLRPETVRGLIVHSAQWTPQMREHFNPKKSKIELKNMLRRYGMGVPSLVRARNSAQNAVTLVAESRIHPFRRENNSEAKLREINYHALPWPVSELENLGETLVKLRVTLSYFIEPNPSNRGWRRRYAYPSHGLRFYTRRPEDDLKTFEKRINTAARSEGEKLTSATKDTGWLFGTKQHEAPGSLHTDIWEGTAADLAVKGHIAVYPVSGWWKHQGKYDQSDKGVDYSLIVSIEAPEVDIDLWTPITNQISTHIEV